MNKNRIENVTYDVFMSMTDKKQIDQVEIRDDQILFTDKEGKIYETVATEDAGAPSAFTTPGPSSSRSIPSPPPWPPC